MLYRNKTRVHIRYDKDARNFIDATGLDNDANLNVSGLYTADEARRALHFFVSGLKNYGIWQNSLGIYVYLGGTTQIAKFNVKKPLDLDSEFRLRFNNSPTIDSLGVQFNGSNQTADTFISPLSHLNLNETFIGTNNLNPSITNGFFMGVTEAVTPSQTMISFNSNNIGNINSYSVYFLDPSFITNKVGLRMGYRNSSSTTRHFISDKLVSASISSTALSPNFIKIGGESTGAQLKTNFSIVGTLITDNQVLSLDYLVKVFNNSLKRF